jgi:hypothetical protein
VSRMPHNRSAGGGPEHGIVLPTCRKFSKILEPAPDCVGTDVKRRQTDFMKYSRPFRALFLVDFSVLA